MEPIFRLEIFAVNLTEEDAERVFRKGYMGEVITVGVRPEDLVLTEEGTEHEGSGV